MPDGMMLFTDGSVSGQTEVGYGAYLLVPHFDFSIAELQSKVKVRRFDSTTSTKLELQTLLWALTDIIDGGDHVDLVRRLTIYTDSQAIVGLSGRRDRIEKNDYRSKKNELLRNHELYRQFYQMVDIIDCEFVKVQGHQPSHQKSDIDRFFTLVDRASRNAMKVGTR